MEPAQLCFSVHTIHTYIHTYIIYIHTHIHTYIHTHIYIHIIHTHTHTYIHAYTHMYIHTYTLTYTHTYIHTCIHTYIRTCMHTHTYVRTHIHTHIHKYIFKSFKSILILCYRNYLLSSFILTILKNNFQWHKQGLDEIITLSLIILYILKLDSLKINVSWVLITTIIILIESQSKTHTPTRVCHRLKL